MLEEIRRTAQRRLREIEPLVREAAQLRNVLEVLEGAGAGESERAGGESSSHRELVPGELSSRTQHTSRRVVANGHGSAHPDSEPAPRAAKGANKRLILDVVRRHPGIKPAEISQLTGMKRTVVASTVSRLKRQGDLREHERGGVRCVR
jgi:hypothetical protein